METSLSGTGFTAMRLARDLGTEVLFLCRDTDYYPARGSANPRDCDAITRIIECETNDPARIACALDRLGVGAVLAAGEHHADIAARAAAMLGVPGLSVQAAVTAKNKAACLAAADDVGVRVPEYGTAATAQEAVSTAARVGYPCVVKPVDGTASVSVRFCTTPGDVREAAEAALRERRNPRGQLTAGEVIVTAYVAGYEVSAEALAVDGTSTVIGITDKHTGPLPWFVETGHTFPSLLPEEMLRPCAQATLAVLARIGFDRGMAHAEFRITPDGPCLIEVNARPAGDHITELIRLATGADPLLSWVQAQAGLPCAPFPAARSGAAIRYLVPPPGPVLSVSGTRRLLRMPGVREASVRIRPGDVIPAARDSHDRRGHVITTGSTAALAERNATLATAQLLLRFARPGEAA